MLSPVSTDSSVSESYTVPQQDYQSKYERWKTDGVGRWRFADRQCADLPRHKKSAPRSSSLDNLELEFAHAPGLHSGLTFA